MKRKSCGNLRSGSTHHNELDNGKSSTPENQIVKLAMNGEVAKASERAVRRQQKMGLPITFKKGKRVVKEFPDGRTETLAEIETPKFKIPKGVHLLGRK